MHHKGHSRNRMMSRVRILSQFAQTQNAQVNPRSEKLRVMQVSAAVRAYAHAVDDHNNKVESIPSYIFYEEKHSHSNYVCGDINQEYKFITKFMEPSEKEKNIHSRMYCNKAIQILSNGCTSKPMTFGFFTNEKGAHFTMITRDK